MGLFDKIKNALFSQQENQQPVALSEFDRLIRDTRIEWAGKENNYFWNIKVAETAVCQKQTAHWENQKRLEMILYCVREKDAFWHKRDQASSEQSQENHVREGYINYLLRSAFTIGDEELDQIVDHFIRYKKWGHATVLQWPVSALLSRLTSQYRNSGLTGQMKQSLSSLRTAVEQAKDDYGTKQKPKLIEKIDQLLFDGRESGGVKPVLFLGKEEFGTYANGLVLSLPEAEQLPWYLLIAKAQKASGSRPSKKYLDESLLIIKDLGTDRFKRMTWNWFQFVVDFKEKITQHTENYGNQAYTYTTAVFLDSVNLEAVKGFVWMCANFYDQTTLNLVAKLAERCFRKIPGQGPAAAAVGNACLYTLYQSKGLDGVGHLSRLKLRIRQASTQSLIEKYIADAAEKQGVSAAEIEDMSVEDFKLSGGSRSYQFDDYSCSLSITGIGKSVLQWYKPDGSPQKTVPSFVSDKHAARLKKIKATQKQIDQTTSAQRDRIDRMFRTGRVLACADFMKFYRDHGLLAEVTGKMIWNFHLEGRVVPVMWYDGKWMDIDQEVFLPAGTEQVSFWHPALRPVAEVQQWRALLIGLKIQQPLKQAFREVYLLTEAEVNTKSYSNRMASHVLKQHQFNMLAKTRGWKYALMGAYDDGRYNESASVLLPEYQLRAEYWVNELNVDGAFNETGIWNYITTDQVRFTSTVSNQVVDLVDVPALVLSEVMRDVDLFVGVASVGNDPTWQDSGGIPAYRDYWSSYSFGDLSEVAKNRKEILTGLVPRLKIARVSEIKDKFLVVRGKLRTYKIHLGSTNILMEPNDQYLCIVPDRSQKSHTENLFIPFEGDAGLSVILSKAFLLADDDKITDKTITSQINRS